MKYSIIIPSFNRADELSELLHSLSNLTFPSERFEIIISDDGSQDNTKTLVASFKEKLPAELIYLHQQNKGPGAARNHAMEKANGDFFIFIDSDVTMPANWLNNIAQAVEEQNADAFGGPDTFHASFSPLLKAINYSMTSFLTTGGLRGKKGKKLAKFYPRSFNMGISKKLWQKIGGFSALRHGQDIEFSHRIINSGAKVLFVDNAPVFHKRRTSLKRFFKQVFNWGVARINLYKIDSGMLEILHAAPAFVTLFVFLFLFFGLLFEPVMFLVKIGFYIGIFAIFLSMLDAARMYRSIKPALWLPFVMCAQVFGYGLGFIFNFIRRIIFKREVHTGFSKNYYK